MTDTHPYDVRTANAVVSPAAPSALKTLHRAVALLRDADRGWWEANITDVGEAVDTAARDGTSLDAEAIIVGAMAVEGARATASLDPCFRRVGRLAVAFATVCGVVTAAR